MFWRDLERVNPYRVIRFWRGAFFLSVIVGAVGLGLGLTWIANRQVAYNRGVRALILERCR